MNKDRTNLNTALEIYLKSGQQFGEGEEFYLLGSEAANLTRCDNFQGH